MTKDIESQLDLFEPSYFRFEWLVHVKSPYVIAQDAADALAKMREETPDRPEVKILGVKRKDIAERDDAEEAAEWAAKQKPVKKVITLPPPEPDEPLPKRYA